MNCPWQRGHSQGAQRSISTVPRILDSCFGQRLEMRFDDPTFLAEIKELIKAVAEEVGAGCGFVVHRGKSQLAVQEQQRASLLDRFWAHDFRQSVFFS